MKSKLLIGIWDSRISQVNLGTLLIFIEELLIQSQLNQIKNIQLAYLKSRHQSRRVKNLFEMTGGFQKIQKYTFFSAVNSLKKYIESNSAISWPIIQRQNQIQHIYTNTLNIQKHFKKNHSIPWLKCKTKITAKALDIIFSQTKNLIPAVVHLKNNPRERKSNADFETWYKFFIASKKHKDLVFILIGNEPVDADVLKLPNVLLSRNLGSDLLIDLALIEISMAFLGMASGPANMAIFNSPPYLIFKDPDHHKEEMHQELGKRNHYVFAQKHQLVLREKQNIDSLIEYFDRIYIPANKQRWKRKFIRLTN